jgi:exonuclease SbcC
VVESAPVSLCILDPEGKVLAANRAALTLLGVERLHDVIGTLLDRLVVTEHRERFTAFVKSVCGGEAGTLQYEFAVPGGTLRSVETHAVPLRREASATAAFLGVTWDVSEKKHAAAALQQLQQKWEQLEAQRSAEREMWEEALRGAREAHQGASTGQPGVQSTVSDAEPPHGHATAQLTAERDALLGRLTDAEARHETLASQVLLLHNVQRAALEEAERKYQTSLAARVEAHRQIEQTLEDRTRERDVLEAAVKQARSAYDVAIEDRNRIQATLDDVEQRRTHQAAESTAQWTAERAALLGMLTEAGERCDTLAAQLLSHETARRAALEETERTHQASLASQAEAHRQIERTLEERTRERDVLEEAIKEARSAYDAVAEDRNRIQAQLAELEARREQQVAERAAQWTAERDALLQKLTHAAERCDTLAGQLIIDQNAQRATLEQAGRKHEAALAARAEAHRQTERTLEDRTRERDVLEEAVRQAQSVSDVLADDRSRLQTTLAEVEQRLAHHTAEWAAEREGLLARLISLEHAQREGEKSLAARNAEHEQLKRALDEARISFEELLEESHAECETVTGQLQDLQRQNAAVAERWQQELVETLGPLDDVSARIERLLHESRNARSASDAGRQDRGETPAQPVKASTEASPEAESEDEEASWRF